MPRTKSMDGQPLPSARRVSNVVHNSNNQVQVSARFTPYLTHFGQFLDHDISSTPIMTGINVRKTTNIQFSQSSNSSIFCSAITRIKTSKISSL